MGAFAAKLKDPCHSVARFWREESAVPLPADNRFLATLGMTKAICAGAVGGTAKRRFCAGAEGTGPAGAVSGTAQRRLPQSHRDTEKNKRSDTSRACREWSGSAWRIRKQIPRTTRNDNCPFRLGVFFAENVAPKNEMLLLRFFEVGAELGDFLFNFFAVFGGGEQAEITGVGFECVAF